MTTIYILKNESIPGVVKIGITTDLEKRIKQLSNTSVPTPFECHYSVQVKTTQANQIEKLIHEIFDDRRKSKQKEFFDCELESAKAVLVLIETMGEKSVSSTETAIEQHTNTKQGKRNYFEYLKIAKGEELTFAKDNTITCKVAENNKVIYKGKKVTLTKSALNILNTKMGYKSTRAGGPGNWCYKGTTLSQLYLNKYN